MMRRLVAIVIAGALLGVSPSPAGAADQISGPFLYVKTEVAATPDATTSASETCPEGTRATGVGAAVRSDLRLLRALLHDSYLDDGTDPDDTGLFDVYNPTETAGTLKMAMICMRSEDRTVLTYQTGSFTAATVVTGAASYITCPGGTAERVVGGGAGLEANTYDQLARIGPESDNTFAYAFNGENPGSRTFTAAMACLPDGHRRVVRIERDAPDTYGPGKTATMKLYCPPGTHVTGGGGGTGLTSALLRSMPIDGNDADKVPDDGWVAVARNPLQTPMTMRGYAVCVGKEK